LLGEPVLVRLPAELWRAWLNDPYVLDRFHAKQYVRRPDQCWHWTGAISSTGHGSFRAASLPGPSRRGTVPAHLFAYQHAYGVISRLGWSDAEDPVVCHRCDEAGCTNPRHLRLGIGVETRAEWTARRNNPSGPLADIRGAAGRARALARAIRDGRKRGCSIEQIEELIAAAARKGMPWTLW
jgi:hypothetical protein